MKTSGAVSKSEKEKLSNIAYQLQNCSDSWISKNHGKFVEMQNEYKKQFKKVYGHTNYADPNTMAKGGNIEFRKLAKSNGFDIIVEEGRFEISVDANGNPKTITNWNAKNPVNISAKNSPLVSKYKTKIMNYIGSDKMAKGGNISEGQMKILNALAGYNNGRNLNGILEGMFLSDFKSNKYATEAQTNTVKKNLNSLIKKGFVEEEGLGYSITQEGANYRRSNMAKGGKTASPKPKMVRTQFEEEEFEYGNGGLLSGFNYSIGGL